MARRWTTVILIPLTAGVAVSAFSGFLAITGARQTATYDEDAVVVLGTTVRGREVPRALAGRLDTALEYRRRNPDALLIVSGGMNATGEVAEAVAMRDYLVERGVPASGIVLEDRSTSTRENVVFTRALLDERRASGYRVCIVTDGFHVYRATRMARAAGLDVTHLSSAASWRSWPADHLREMVAVALMWSGRL